MINSQPRPEIPAAGGPAAEADDYFRRYLNRTIMLLGDDAVQTLRTKTVAIAGCGGLGGATAILLARMGVSGFRLADPGVFDEPDINRQWAATLATLGRNKAVVHADILRSIQPDARIEVFAEGVSEDNVEDFLGDADVVVDCLDVAVPHALRVRLYQTTRAHGLYCITAPMLGFGAILVAATPDGIPMEAVYGRAFADAVDNAALPPGLAQLVVPEHLAAIEHHMPRRKAPSVSISPALAATLVSTELFLALLGPSVPGWRPPLSLPAVMVVDPIRGTFRVLPLPALMTGPEAAPAAVAAGPSPSGADDSGPDERRQVLARVAYNTNLLPASAIAIDLLSDSWSERRLAPEAVGEELGDGRLVDRLRGLYGYKHIVPLFRGRFAEALLAHALIQPRRTVVANALFPTTRFHLTSRGALVREVPVPIAEHLDNPAPFKGDLDLAALRELLASEDVQAVYVELCPNTLGGPAVSLANLRAIRELATRHGVPVLLDATRAFANAALLAELEPSQSGRSLVGIVRDLCACSDACAASLSKDFRSLVGGFVASNDGPTFTKLQDLAILAYGTGLSEIDQVRVAAALDASPDAPEGAAGRTAGIRRLHAALTSLAVPVIQPAGGHAVFVDAAAWLPHLGVEQHRGVALANALFVAGGVRAGLHMASPAQVERGLDLVRLALPVGAYTETELERVAATFAAVGANRERIPPLRQVSAPDGEVGAYLASFEPDQQ